MHTDELRRSGDRLRPQRAGGGDHAGAGRARVLVVEGKATPGGGMRTQEITLPGFRHDICSAIHPLGLASPFFRDLPLADFGLEWILPPVVAGASAGRRHAPSR